MSRTYYAVASVCAFLVPFATLIGLAVLPASAAGEHITWAEAVTAVVATILTTSAAALPSTAGGKPSAVPEDAADGPAR